MRCSNKNVGHDILVIFSQNSLPKHIGTEKIYLRKSHLKQDGREPSSKFKIRGSNLYHIAHNSHAKKVVSETINKSFNKMEFGNCKYI